MAATYMLRKYLASQEAAGRPEAVAERAIRHEACKRGGDDRREKYPVITADNFEEADNYQRERIEEWTRRLTPAI